MSELDVRTRNILAALESFLDESIRVNDTKTHEEYIVGLMNATIATKTAHDRFKLGELSPRQYGKVLMKLAETTLMAVRRLPS